MLLESGISVARHDVLLQEGFGIRTLVLSTVARKSILLKRSNKVVTSLCTLRYQKASLYEWNLVFDIVDECG
jgi:hypothetical protein